MTRERFNFLDYTLFVLILVIFAILSFVFQVNQIFSFDQTQMLIKGYHAALTGEYLPFGNEASTTGNLPGSLSSFVIGFPFHVYFHAYSPIYFQIFLRIIAILFFANGLAQIFSKKLVLAGTCLFALSTWTLMQGMLYNPAYLPVGACAFFCALTHIRNDNENRVSAFGRVFWSMLAVLGIGWCLQFHFSWPVLLFVAGLMWLRKDVKVSYFGLALGVALVGLSLFPYINELMLNPTLIKSPDGYGSERYLGYGFVHVYPVFKGLLYWFRFGSLLFTQKAIVPEFSVDEDGLLIAIIAYVWIGISSLIGGISVLFAAYCNYFTLFKYRLSNHAGRMNFIRGLTFSSIVSVLIAAGLNTLTLNYWQIAIIMPFALVPLLAFMAQKPRVLKRYMTVAVCFLAATNILAATYSSDYDIRVNYRQELYKTCLEAFNQEQCGPLTVGLTDSEIAQTQSTTKLSPEVILRVIDGIKPLPWNADDTYIEQYIKARKTVQHYRFALPPGVTMPPIIIPHGAQEVPPEQMPSLNQNTNDVSNTSAQASSEDQAQDSAQANTQDSAQNKAQASKGAAAEVAAKASDDASKANASSKQASSNKANHAAQSNQAHKAASKDAKTSKESAAASDSTKATNTSKTTPAAKGASPNKANSDSTSSSSSNSSTKATPDSKDAQASSTTDSAKARANDIPDAAQSAQNTTPTYVQPANTPITQELTPANSTIQVVDKGSGASGELVIY